MLFFFYNENAHIIFGFYNLNWVFPLLWGEFIINLDFIIPKAQKNRTRSFFSSSDYRIRMFPKHHFSGEKGSNYIILTISAQILSLFIIWITSLKTILIFLITSFYFRSLLAVFNKKKSEIRATWSYCYETFPEN